MLNLVREFENIVMFCNTTMMISNAKNTLKDIPNVNYDEFCNDTQ